MKVLLSVSDYGIEEHGGKYVDSIHINPLFREFYDLLIRYTTNNKYSNQDDSINFVKRTANAFIETFNEYSEDANLDVYLWFDNLAIYDIKNIHSFDVGDYCSFLRLGVEKVYNDYEYTDFIENNFVQSMMESYKNNFLKELINQIFGDKYFEDEDNEDREYDDYNEDDYDEDDEYETLDTVMVVFFVCIIKGNPIGIIQL